MVPFKWEKEKAQTTVFKIVGAVRSAVQLRDPHDLHLYEYENVVRRTQDGVAMETLRNNTGC